MNLKMEEFESKENTKDRSNGAGSSSKNGLGLSGL
jgi:hypothetical protein